MSDHVARAADGVGGRFLAGAKLSGAEKSGKIPRISSKNCKKVRIFFLEIVGIRKKKLKKSF